MIQQFIPVCLLLYRPVQPTEANTTDTLHNCSASRDLEQKIYAIHLQIPPNISDQFYMYVRGKKENPDADIAYCNRVNVTWACSVQDERFESAKIDGGVLLLFVSEVSSRLEDEYTLYVGSFTSSNCQYWNNGSPVLGAGGKDQPFTVILISVIVVLLSVIAGLLVVVYKYRKKCNRGCTCVEQCRNLFKNRTTDGRTGPEKSQRVSETDDDLHPDQLLLDISKEGVCTFGDKDKEKDNATSNTERMTGNEIELVSTEKTSEYHAPLHLIPYGAKSTCGEHKPIPIEDLESAHRKLHSPNTPKTPTKEQEKSENQSTFSYN